MVFQSSMACGISRHGIPFRRIHRAVLTIFGYTRSLSRQGLFPCLWFRSRRPHNEGDATCVSRVKPPEAFRACG